MKRTAQDYAAELSALSPIEIPKARWKMAFAAGVLVPSTALFAWVLTLPGVSKLFVGGLLAVFLVLSAYAVALLVRPPVLRLDREGFGMKTAFNDFHERWDDADGFERIIANRAWQVGYRMLRAPKSTSEGVALKLTGGMGFVGTGYVLSAKQLAVLMQDYRNRAVRSPRARRHHARVQAVEWVPPATAENYPGFAHLSR